MVNDLHLVILTTGQGKVQTSDGSSYSNPDMEMEFQEVGCVGFPTLDPVGKV